MHNVFGGGIYFERAELKQQFRRGQLQLLCMHCCPVAVRFTILWCSARCCASHDCARDQLCAIDVFDKCAMMYPNYTWDDGASSYIGYGFNAVWSYYEAVNLMMTEKRVSSAYHGVYFHPHHSSPILCHYLSIYTLYRCIVLLIHAL